MERSLTGLYILAAILSSAWTSNFGTEGWLCKRYWFSAAEQCTLILIDLIASADMVTNFFLKFDVSTVYPISMYF